MNDKAILKALTQIALGATSNITLQTPSRTGEMITETLTPIQVLAQAILIDKRGKNGTRA